MASPPSRSYKFNEAIIKCPLCSKLYSNPRLLPCLHSFCLDCLTSHIQDGNQTKHDSQRKTAAQRNGKSPSPSPTGIKPKNGPTTGQARPGAPTKSPDKSSGTKPKAPSPVQNGGKPKSPQKDAGQTNGIGTNSKYKTGDKGFPCPCCKKFVSTPQLPKTSPDKWAEQFPENNLLADLVDLHTLRLGTRGCDPCKRNKSNSQVQAYCKNCRDALCESCALTHKGLRSCRNHKVLNMAEFAEAVNSMKVEEEFCDTHDDKTLEHYCHSHGVLCCSQCMSESHRKCENVVPVADAVRKSRESGDITTLGDAIGKYKHHVDIVSQDRSTMIKKMEAKKTKLFSEFIGVKKHIIAQLEKMEKDLKTILDATHRSEAKKIQQELERCKEIQSAIINTGELLKAADKHGSNSQLMALLDKMRVECECYEESINLLCLRLRAVDYDIALDESLQEVMKRLNQFGRIDVNTTAAKLPQAPKLASTLGLQSAGTKVKAVKPTITLQGTNAREIGEFSASSDDDTQDCWFTGALFLPDGRILLADRTNKKLKLFTSNFKPVSDTVLSSKPWDITLVADKEIAVSLPTECKIDFVTVSATTLTQTRSIFTDEPCFGICHSNGKILAVSYDGDPPNLKVMTLTGKELTYVCVDESGFPLFSKPVYVASSRDGKEIYVSDERLGCVVILKETGELNFDSSAVDLGHAAGITVDKDGNIYVCGSTSSSVHVVSPSLDRVKVLVTSEYITYPRAIAFEPRERKLLVTQGNQDVVKLYSLA